MIKVPLKSRIAITYVEGHVVYFKIDGRFVYTNISAYVQTDNIGNIDKVTDIIKGDIEALYSM